MTDDLHLFSAVPQSVREAMLDLWKRLPEEYWLDTLSLLEMAEKRALPGKLCSEWDHDARGRVNHVTHSPEWHRQRVKRTA